MTQSQNRNQPPPPPPPRDQLYNNYHEQQNQRTNDKNNNDDVVMELPEIHYLILKTIYWENDFVTGSIVMLLILLWMLCVFHNYSILTLISIVFIFILSTSIIYINCLYFYTNYTTNNLPPNFKFRFLFFYFKYIYIYTV